MRKLNFIVKGMYLYKVYKKDQLLDTRQEVENRVALINSFEYKRYQVLAPTSISVEKDDYIVKQHYYERELYDYKSIQKDDFLDLIEALEYFNAIGFVHGDINRKNIIRTKQGFKIIDYEPSLLQIKNGIKNFMVTLPYISSLDLKENRISIRTDKLGFFYFVLRVRKKLSPKIVVELTKTLKHEDILLIDEDALKEISYKELLDKAYLIN